MALKNYKVKPSISTETDLIATLSGVSATIISFEILAPTAGTFTIKRNDGTSDYANEVFVTTVNNDGIVLDHSIVIPDGHKVTVESDQSDTWFIANVSEA